MSIKYEFFVVKAMNPAADQEALNRFCESHTLAQVDKQLVSSGIESYWAFCIQYVEPGGRTAQPRRSRIDYREVLSEQDFSVYAKLRSLRKELAEKDGVPLYTVFTNELMSIARAAKRARLPGMVVDAAAARSNPRRGSHLARGERGWML